MNIRTLTGTLTTQHPELRDIFQETAGFTVTKAKGQEVKFKDGTKGTVWRGEYETTRDTRTLPIPARLRCVSRRRLLSSRIRSGITWKSV